MGHRLRPFTPALYHGTQNSRPYFEGWYFKLAHPEHPLAVIPGVFRGLDSAGDMSFVQVLYGPGNASVFIPFPFSAFSSDENRFDVAVGENRFSMDGMRLRLEKDGFSLRGEAAFSRHRFPKGTAMGPFAYLPKMQCSHGVLSLGHAVDGTLFLSGTKLDAQGSCGYIEKDWGSAFPPSWMWLQGNSPGQNGEDVAFTCSVARVPYGPFRFTGHVAVLSVGDRQYRMATYNGSRIARLRADGHSAGLVLRRGALTLSVAARSQSFGTLAAPTRTGMDRTIGESLDAALELTLIKGGRTLLSATLKGCGMELSGTEALMK